MLKRSVRTNRGATPVREKMNAFFVRKSVATVLVRTPILQKSCFFHVLGQTLMLVTPPFFKNAHFLHSSTTQSYLFWSVPVRSPSWLHLVFAQFGSWAASGPSRWGLFGCPGPISFLVTPRFCTIGQLGGLRTVRLGTFRIVLV